MARLVRPSWSSLSGRKKEGRRGERRFWSHHTFGVVPFLEPAQAGQDKPP